MNDDPFWGLMVGLVLGAVVAGVVVGSIVNHHNEKHAIKYGFAEYHQTTGKWQWKDINTLIPRQPKHEISYQPNHRALVETTNIWEIFQKYGSEAGVTAWGTNMNLIFTGSITTNQSNTLPAKYWMANQITRK